MIETILSWVNNTLGSILFFLPESPFIEYIEAANEWEWLGWFNWLVPVGDFIKIGSAWLAAVGGYYLYSVVLRWIKAID